MKVTMFNPALRESEKTFLSDPIGIGALSLPVRSSSNYAVDQYVIIGQPRLERAEMKKITAISSATAMAIQATTYNHSSDDPVYRADYNKIRLYRAASSIGAYSLIDTVDIDWANPKGTTIYNDPNGVAASYYKFDYYNDVSTASSALSDPIPGVGYGRLVAGEIISDVLEDVHDTDEQVSTREQLLENFNDCHDYVYDKRKKWRHWRSTALATATAGTEEVPLPDDFDDLDSVWYNYAITGTDISYRLREVSDIEMDGLNRNANATESNRLKKFSLNFEGDSIRTNPIVDTTQTNKITFHYYRTPTVIISEGDELDIPNPSVYKNYLMWRHYIRKDDPKTAKIWKDELDRSIINLVRRQKKGSTQGRSMEYRRGGTRGRYKY
jgi:hypothetical protein